MAELVLTSLQRETGSVLVILEYDETTIPAGGTWKDAQVLAFRVETRGTGGRVRIRSADGQEWVSRLERRNRNIRLNADSRITTLQGVAVEVTS